MEENFDDFADLDACLADIEGFAPEGVDVSAQEDDCAGGACKI